MGFGPFKSSTDTRMQAPPQAPPVPPLAIQQDLRPKKKSMQPTFLGAEATPFAGAGAPSGGGGKTLLGQ